MKSLEEEIKDILIERTATDALKQYLKELGVTMSHKKAMKVIRDHLLMSKGEKFTWDKLTALQDMVGKDTYYHADRLDDELGIPDEVRHRRWW